MIERAAESVPLPVGLGSVGVLAPEEGMGTSVVFTGGELVLVIFVRSSKDSKMPKDVAAALVGGLGSPSVVER